MTRKMAQGLQEQMIRRALVRGGVDPEKFDVRAHMDRSLHLGENLRIARAHHGISGGRHRDYAAEAAEERARTRASRADPLRQVGLSNEAMDRRFRALRPGKRRSSVTGKVYYERRANRTDRNPHERL